MLRDHIRRTIVFEMIYTESGNFGFDFEKP